MRRQELRVSTRHKRLVGWWRQSLRIGRRERSDETFMRFQALAVDVDETLTEARRVEW